jgi:hypothetical protein
MSRQSQRALSPFSPFDVILQDRLEKMFEVEKNDDFRFVVNGEVLESTLADAVLISPIV